MIERPSIQKRDIRWHYDLITAFYRLLWGPHIHHGLWDGDESPAAAQLKLTDTLADLLAIQSGDRLLDIGCGMGGSSIHLAKARGCHATGVTISPVQRRWARFGAWRHGAGRQTDFRCADAEAIEFSPASFDVLWSIECTEHLFQKPQFFKRAATWLEPGGRLGICAWLAGDVRTPEAAAQVYRVCDEFLCPSLGSSVDYVNWFEAAGLEMVAVHDWTSRVTRTWEICIERVEKSGLRRVAGWIDRAAARFIDGFQTILDAYRSGAMQYGCFIARRPEGDLTPRPAAMRATGTT